MALLRKVELEENGIVITLKLTKQEYAAITPDTKEIIALPAGGKDDTLTTGRLGNGNRIMIPNKLLRNNKIDVLKKNVKYRLVDTGEKKFLVIELDSKEMSVPVFSEV